MNEAPQKIHLTKERKRRSLNLRTKDLDCLYSQQQQQIHDPKKAHIVEVRSLLSELVNTTAAVLTSRPIHVWQVYGGFQRIYEVILNIFYHGCVHKDGQGSSDIWPFIIGLRVLSPVLGPSSEVTQGPKPADWWIHRSLQKLQLSDKISALTVNRDHVEKHYYPWAIFRSQTHISAVITCLKALENNSQDGLADIDPKLLIGDYYPPPSSPATAPPDITDKLSRMKAQLFDPGIREVPKDDCSSGNHPKFTTTKSLPTTPCGQKDGSLSWPYSHHQNHIDNQNNTSGHHSSVCQPSNECKDRSSNIRVPRSTRHPPPIQRGRSEASIQINSSNRTRRRARLLDDDDISSGFDITSLMHRESPDGSSGSSDWPVNSPISQPIPFIRKESPQLSSASSSPIARLVKREDLSKTDTGARPKQFHSSPSSTTPFKNSDILKHHHQLDLLSDSSEAGAGGGSGISPSLLKVDYGGGKYSHSDGDGNSVHDSSRGGGGSGVLETKTPQLRRRASSGRLGSAHADSDHDSEDTLDGIVAVVQGVRRKKRPTVSQHKSGVSVKLLIDSRGVLKSDPSADKSMIKHNKTQPKNITHNPSISSKSKEPKLNIERDHSPVLSQNKNQDIVEYAKSQTISTPLNPPPINVLATSAPGTAINVSISGQQSHGKRKTHSRSRSDGSQEISTKLKLASSNTAPTLETKMRLDDESIFGSQMRKRFMDDGGHSITPAADYGVSPRPQPGQSLIGFLSSKDKPYAELDRENAHFNISEAVIAALTQMQFDVWQGKSDDGVGGSGGEESDEEIRSLQAQIQEKRRQKQTKGSTPRVDHSNCSSSSDPQCWIQNQSVKIESSRDFSTYESPQSSAYNSESDLLSELEEEASENSTSEATSICLSSSTVSTDHLQLIGGGDSTSAESVAINLLKHFSEQKLPKASELEWLVSEQDVPQKLLPLPTSVAVSPDDGGIEKEPELHMQLRGTSDWAPPRPQLILTLHTKTKRSVLMGIQRWRCAGCGMRVSEDLSRHFRMCHYLGRYFCTTCHRNQVAMIPAKVLHKWDFKLYPVSNFSSELLERMKIDPLINVGALNPKLYKKCRHLHQTHIYRLQLYHTLPYINTCGRAHGEKMTLGKLPIHWASDPHVYSLNDLDCIRAGQLVESIKKVTSLCIRHISKCEVCLGRGFICEICCKGEPIFPFQLDSTALCDICSACFHEGCFCPNRCPRCIRRESRRLSRDTLVEADSFESSIDKDS